MLSGSIESTRTVSKSCRSSASFNYVREEVRNLLRKWRRSMTKTTLEEKWAEKKQGKLPLEEIYESGKKETDPQTLNPEKITDSVLDQLPAPTGWRIMVLPYQGKKVSDGGIHLVSKALERQQAATVLGLVLKTGSLAYDGERFSKTGPWCKEGDWVLYARYAGSRIDIDGGEIKILNDDEIIATVADPESIIHNF